MKPTAILSEAWRDIAAGAARALTCATILTVIAVAVATFDLTGILALQHESRQWVDSAAAIHIISGGKQINGERRRGDAHPSRRSAQGRR